MFRREGHQQSVNHIWHHEKNSKKSEGEKEKGGSDASDGEAKSDRRNFRSIARFFVCQAEITNREVSFMSDLIYKMLENKKWDIGFTFFARIDNSQRSFYHLVETYYGVMWPVNKWP